MSSKTDADARKGGFCVGIVGAPQKLVDAEQFALGDAAFVILEAHEDVLAIHITGEHVSGP